MPPVVSALLAFMAALFRSRASLRLEHLALRHQLAMYQQTSIAHDSVRPIACSGRGSRGCGLPGKTPWCSFNPVRSSPGSASAFATTGDS